MTGLFAKHKEAVFSLIAWTIVATGCLVYFNVLHKTRKPSSNPPSAASPANDVSTASTASTASSDIDFTGYFDTFDRLAERLNEQQEFVKGLKGKTVRWRGFVSYVRNSDVSQSRIALAITPAPHDDLRVALVYFAEDMRGPLFALREGDSVEITGTFESESWNTPYIRGQTLQRLSAGPHTPAAAPTAAR